MKFWIEFPSLTDKSHGMNERLLKAIMQLFAIVAKEDDIADQEKHQIEMFLLEHLNKTDVPGYLDEFDTYCDSIVIKAGASIEEESKSILPICNRINEELTQKQKVVILLKLIDIILADGEISPREDRLIKLICDSFNIHSKVVDIIKQYAGARSLNDLPLEEVLVIDNSKYIDGSRHIERSGLDGFIAILHIKSSDSFFVKYLGKSSISLNGIPVGTGKISMLAVGSTIKLDKGDPVYFGDVIAQFITRDESLRVSFEANNISYKFKNGTLGLRDVTIEEESGRLVGLMGASGAGKSTLLHVLNGSETPSSGQVLINGINIHTEKHKIKGVIGFVPQDDLLIDDLTVYQNLFYSAKLCFSHYTNEQVNDLVEKILDDLGLTETKNLKVGSPLEKIISGGQRKRLNIGLELLREPTVMFVDEPTSGLSSRDSENIMNLLKELCLKGKLIFVVIHQPSSDIFKMFDKLVILDTGGYQIYYGNPVEAVTYFKERINMVNSQEGECRECGNVNPEQIFNIIETKIINEYGNFTPNRKVSPEQWSQYYVESSLSQSVETSLDEPKSTLRIPSKLKQTILFSTRDILSKLSNRQYLLINLLEAPALAFLLAYIVKFYDVHNTVDTEYLFSKNMNIPVFFFMSIIVSLFMGLTVSAEEIFKDKKILKRESFLNLSKASYILSKLFILFSMSAIQTFLFVLVGDAILGIGEMTTAHWFILFSTSCMANVLGLNISASFNSAVTIYILIPILLIPQLLLSGVVVKFDQVNPKLSGAGKVPLVGEVMTSRWAFEAAMVTQFRDNPYERQFYIYDKLIADSFYKRMYQIPNLESKIQFCNKNYKSTEQELLDEAIINLNILRNELVVELHEMRNQVQLPLEKLNIDNYSYEVGDEILSFLDSRKEFYNSRYIKANEAKDKKLLELTETPEKKERFDRLKNDSYNESIADIVRNQNDFHKIIETEDELVQNVNTIYMTPRHKHLFDFRTEFYSPVKYFFGRYYDTFFFNMAVIWFMSLVLVIMLYFDILRKVVSGIGNAFSINR